MANEEERTNDLKYQVSGGHVGFRADDSQALIDLPDTVSSTKGLRWNCHTHLVVAIILMLCGVKVWMPRVPTIKFSRFSCLLHVPAQRTDLPVHRLINTLPVNHPYES
jgi:hypothetical protein